MTALRLNRPEINYIVWLRNYAIYNCVANVGIAKQDDRHFSS